MTPTIKPEVVGKKKPFVPKKRREFLSRKASDKLWFWLFLMPVLIPFLLMVITPFITGIYYSFTNWTGGLAPTEWVGLDNYRGLTSDHRFIYSFYRTVIYAILNVLAINLVAFALALLVTRKLKLTNFYRAGFFLPNLIGGLVIGYLWSFIYRIVLGASGLGLFSSSPLVSRYAMFALVAVVTWQYAGYIMMIYIAALQNIPEDLIEASQIDGANALQRLRNITLPLVAQAFTVALFLTLVTAFKQFDTVFSLTRGGPDIDIPVWLQNALGMEFPRAVGSTRLVAFQIYNWGISRGNFAVAQAQAVVFFVLLSVISLGQVYFNKKREVEL
ncbi:MAG: sugar ABC transporter permease [Acholeplasmatales bacterium]|nr:MAG: sugar ABC transporter permease [Acholeplasmatales bacterium]